MLPNGGIVLAKNLTQAIQVRNPSQHLGWPAQLNLLNATQNEVNKNVGCGCGGDACAIF